MIIINLHKKSHFVVLYNYSIILFHNFHWSPTISCSTNINYNTKYLKYLKYLKVPHHIPITTHAKWIHIHRINKIVLRLTYTTLCWLPCNINTIWKINLYKSLFQMTVIHSRRQKNNGFITFCSRT